MKNKIVVAALLMSPLLFGCSGPNTIQKGYDRFKADMQQLYPSDNLTFVSCNYVYIKNCPNQHLLDDTCYYYAQFKVNSTAMYSYFAYAAKDDSFVYDMTEDNEGVVYYTVAGILTSNLAEGETGSI